MVWENDPPVEAPSFATCLPSMVTSLRGEAVGSRHVPRDGQFLVGFEDAVLRGGSLGDRRHWLIVGALPEWLLTVNAAVAPYGARAAGVAGRDANHHQGIVRVRHVAAAGPNERVRHSGRTGGEARCPVALARNSRGRLPGCAAVRAVFHQDAASVWNSWSGQAVADRHVPAQRSRGLSPRLLMGVGSCHR